MIKYLPKMSSLFRFAHHKATKIQGHTLKHIRILISIQILMCYGRDTKSHRQIGVCAELAPNTTNIWALFLTTQHQFECMSA